MLSAFCTHLQERCSQLEVSCTKQEEQNSHLRGILQSLQEKAKKNDDMNEAKIKQLQETKTRLDSDVAVSTRNL